MISSVFLEHESFYVSANREAINTNIGMTITRGEDELSDLMKKSQKRKNNTNKKN